jgi:quercetin dioxygenase-like cupin family protein
MVETRRVLENPRTGERLAILKTAEESGGEVFLTEFFMPPGHVVRSHYHPKQETIFQVFEGKLHARVNTEDRVILPGETLVVPPGVLHQIDNRGPEEVRGLEQYRPAYRTQAYLETRIALAQQGKGGLDLLQQAVMWHAYPETIGVPLLAQPFLLVLAAVGRMMGRKAYLSPDQRAVD